MKLVGVMNGWKQAPNCWLKHLAIPLWMSRYYRDVFEIKFFGFVFFVEFK